MVVESFSEQLTVYLKKVDDQIINQYFYAPPAHGGDAIILPTNSVGKERIFFCNPPFSNLEGHVALVASVPHPKH